MRNKTKSFHQLRDHLLLEFSRASRGIHATQHPSLLLLDRVTRAHPRQRPIPKTLRESHILLAWAGEALNLLEHTAPVFANRSFQRATRNSRSKPMPYTPAVPTQQHWHWVNIRNIAKVVEAVGKKRSRYIPATDSRMAVKEGRKIRATWYGVCALEADAPVPGKWDPHEPYTIEWLNDVLLCKHFQNARAHQNTWRDDRMPENYLLRVFGAGEEFLAPRRMNNWPQAREFTGGIPFYEMLNHWRKIRDSLLSGVPPSLHITKSNQNPFTPIWLAHKAGWE